MKLFTKRISGLKDTLSLLGKLVWPVHTNNYQIASNVLNFAMPNPPKLITNANRAALSPPFSPPIRALLWNLLKLRDPDERVQLLHLDSREYLRTV